MVDVVTGVRLVAGLFLILTNGFFVAIEFALTRVRQYSEAEFTGSAGLERAWEMTERLEIYLTACQVGITASSIAVGIVAEPALVAIFEPLFSATGLQSAFPGSTHLLSAGLAFFLINLLHLTHGEQTPTYLGVERSRQVARFGAPLLHYFTMSIYPLIILGDRVAKATLWLMGVEISRSWTEAESDVVESRAELRHEIGDMLEEQDLSEERREEVIGALDIERLTVGDEMVPRDAIAALRTTNSIEENLEVVEENPHTRFPLVGENLEDFHGIVYIPTVARHFEELHAGETDFEALAAEPMTLPPGLSISEAVDRFQTEGQELAFVVDGDDEDRVVGLLTATDALEAVMGELKDPTDTERATA